MKDPELKSFQSTRCSSMRTIYSIRKNCQHALTSEIFRLIFCLSPFGSPSQINLKISSCFLPWNSFKNFQKQFFNFHLQFSLTFELKYSIIHLEFNLNFNETFWQHFFENSVFLPSIQLHFKMKFSIILPSKHPEIFSNANNEY